MSAEQARLLVNRWPYPLLIAGDLLQPGIPTPIDDLWVSNAGVRHLIQQGHLEIATTPPANESTTLVAATDKDATSQAIHLSTSERSRAESGATDVTPLRRGQPYELAHTSVTTAASPGGGQNTAALPIAETLDQLRAAIDRSCDEARAALLAQTTEQPASPVPAQRGAAIFVNKSQRPLIIGDDLLKPGVPIEISDKWVAHAGVQRLLRNGDLVIAQAQKGIGNGPIEGE
jgi:hypothetical protein